AALSCFDCDLVCPQCCLSRRRGALAGRGSGAGCAFAGTAIALVSPVVAASFAAVLRLYHIHRAHPFPGAIEHPGATLFLRHGSLDVARTPPLVWALFG